MTDPGPLNALFVPAAPKAEHKPPGGVVAPGTVTIEPAKKLVRKPVEPVAAPAEPKTRKRRQNKPLDDIVVLKRCLKLLKSLPPADAKRIVQTLHLLFEL
jgi:hypothetical protein